MPKHSKYSELREYLGFKPECDFINVEIDHKSSKVVYWYEIETLINKEKAKAELVGIKSTERMVIAKFKKLCEEVRTDPALGNSSKGKKDNFLDGAETMLTAVQFHRHNLEQIIEAQLAKGEDNHADQ